MSIWMTPFCTLYGYEPLSFIDLALQDNRAPLAKDWIMDQQDILGALKDNIQQAQNHQKLYADRHRTERSFELGDRVFLHLQPYRQSSLKKSGSEKLKPRFYGPYCITRRIGEIAYKLDLLGDSRIYNVFHVSCLKKAVGQQIVPSKSLPPLDEVDKLILVLEEAIETRERKLRNRTARVYLVQWKDLPYEDAIWEGESILQHPALRLLEGKQSREGRIVMSPSPH